MPEAIPEHVAEAAAERSAAQGGSTPSHKYKRGRFIPVTPSDLEMLLANHVEPDARCAAMYRDICRLLRETVHRHYQTIKRQLQDDYAPLDPDSDVHSLRRCDAEELNRRSTQIFATACMLLEKANFRPLPRGEVDKAVSAVSPWGLNLQVDLEVFDRLEVWARGEKVDHRVTRGVSSLFRVQHHRIPLYQRIMILFRPHASNLNNRGYLGDRVYLKLFKNIPEGDIDMVLPGTHVRMTLLDRGKIVFPVVSGIVVTAWKIIKGALVVAAVGVYGLLAYLTLIIGTVGYGWRSFFGYKRTKEKYQLNLTQNLYYQKLDGDWGALLRLCDEAEDQEYREALTAWFLLWRQAPHDGWLMEELDRSAERLLQAELKRDVDFDVADAVDKMIRWRMVDVQFDGRLTARKPEDVAESLREHLAATPGR
ncbi:MAG: DUF3754 domain-containing protein [Planctomycetales bacterium]|nr:DUF3754 domain-containing protein [Planctomycetales bacterium]